MSCDLISRSALKTKFEERKNKFLNEWEGKDKIPKQELARVDEICLMISSLRDLFSYYYISFDDLLG